MKSRLEVELSDKVRGPLPSSIEEILAAWQRERILACYIIQSSEVDTQTQRAVLLSYSHYGAGPR